MFQIPGDYNLLSMRDLSEQRFKPVQVRYAHGDEAKLFMQHTPAATVDEYKQQVNLHGGQSRLRLYRASFDSRAPSNFFSLSKKLTTLTHAKYRSKGPSRRVGKAVSKLSKKRKREQTMFGKA